MKPGPQTSSQLLRLSREWVQGEHILITGATKSGKTSLARHIVEIRAQRGGHVVVFCMKPLPDPTIITDYLHNGFTRWNTWKKRFSGRDNRILLWPDVSKAKGNRRAILDMQKDIFQEAIDWINSRGRITLQIDEGLYMCAPEFLNMGADLAMAHAIGRSGDLTCVTLAQRPSHLPLILYGSASHAFTGRTRENSDLKRVAEMGPKEGSRALASHISGLDRHGYMWLPVAPDWDAEYVNLRR